MHPHSSKREGMSGVWQGKRLRALMLDSEAMIQAEGIDSEEKAAGEVCLDREKNDGTAIQTEAAH